MSKCPCVPLGMICINEGYHEKPFSCCLHIVNYRLRELFMELPIIKHFDIEPYRCPDFAVFGEYLDFHVPSKEDAIEKHN